MPSPSIYAGAPGMLMDAIHEVSYTLEQSKLKSGETASWKFWKRIEGVMKYSWGYMQSLNFVLKENTQLKAEVAFLRDRLQYVENSLFEYTVIHRLKLNGEFERYVQAVDTCIESGACNDPNVFFRD